ncbi:MAG: hypothetical protein GEU91_21645 [Rhizobiales bacterium]|nr:hypothetical protein [Hyphomicrobiales bacterium]
MIMAFRRGAAVFVALGIIASATNAQSPAFEIKQVPSLAAYPVDRIKPSTIVFAASAQDPTANPTAGLIQFDEWARTRPDEKLLLGLYPDYAERTVARKVGGVTQRYPNKLTMYVAEARFTLRRAPALADLARFATLAFAEQIDPAIKHRLISSAEVTPPTNQRFAHNQNPARPWCTGPAVACLRSHYRLEGKLPLGIQLANKLRDADKKIADYLEFDSELAVRAPEALDLAAVTRLTQINSPIIGVLEQTTFHVNQILQFAKFYVVFQGHPSDPNKAVVTAFFTLAIESRLLDSKKEYARVPVLRNLVPIQVLMGKSSFNTGTSISAGLPNYARSRIRAVAGILDGG